MSKDTFQAEEEIVYKDESVLRHDAFVKQDREMTRAQSVYVPFKRLIDILGSFFGLLILMPMLLVVAVMVIIDSYGPVLYTQKRVGKKGKVFRFYKFRSMIVGAHEMHDKLHKEIKNDSRFFKMIDDPRVTRVGRVIRKYSIDELPQLFNVLRGDMSLVGPRPALLKEIMPHDISQLHNLNIKPGLVCYWQIGDRSMSPEERVKLDEKYVREFGFAIDVKILLKTPGAVIRGTGAY